MEEYLDVLNEDGTKTGESRTFDDVHKEGLLHRTAHVWLLNSKGELLLQKRSANKLIYADHWDISASGHVSAGQTSLEAARQETEEELGLTLPDSAFEHLFSVEEHAVLQNGTYVNNEFQDVNLVHSDATLSEFVLAPDEVAAVRWVRAEEFKSWMKGEQGKLVPHDEEYAFLLERIA